jgi:hypothetical protein
MLQGQSALFGYGVRLAVAEAGDGAVADQFSASRVLQCLDPSFAFDSDERFCSDVGVEDLHQVTRR